MMHWWTALVRAIACFVCSAHLGGGVGEAGLGRAGQAGLLLYGHPPAPSRSHPHPHPPRSRCALACPAADGSGGRGPDYVGTLTNLFKDVAAAVDEHLELIRDTLGPGGWLGGWVGSWVGGRLTRLGKCLEPVCIERELNRRSPAAAPRHLPAELGLAALQALHTECDIHGTRLLQRYADYRRLARIAGQVRGRWGACGGRIGAAALSGGRLLRRRYRGVSLPAWAAEVLVGLLAALIRLPCLP